MKKKLRLLIESLTAAQQDKLYDYVVRFKEVDDLQTLKEEQAIEVAGYNVASELPDHEWEAMLKRNEMSLEKESKK